MSNTQKLLLLKKPLYSYGDKAALKTEPNKTFVIGASEYTNNGFIYSLLGSYARGFAYESELILVERRKYLS